MLKSIFRALQAATLLQGFTRSPTHVATPPPEGSVSRCRNGRAAGGQRSAGWSRTPRTHLDRAHATHSLTHARSHARRNARARDPACTCTHAQIGAIRSFLCVLDALARPLKRSSHQRSHHDRCGQAPSWPRAPVPGPSTKAASASLTLRSPLWHVWLPSTQEAPQGNILNGQ